MLSGEGRPRDSGGPPAAGSGPAMCVLIAEDDPDIRDLVVDGLTAEGYHVLQASNGREALAVATREHPSLIVTDLMMPGMNGWELLRALRADPSLSDIPVVVASASHEIPAEASAFVAKPFGLESLLAAMRSAFSPAGMPEHSVPRSR